MRASDWLMLFALGMLWGGSFFFAAVALTALPPLTIVLARVGIAALALNLLVPLVGEAMPRDRARWRAFLVMGALNNLVPFSLIVSGRATSPAALPPSSTP